MIYTKMTINALNIAEEAHRGQRDKAGAAYILHPIAVAEQMDDEWTTAVALLHDVLEDTSLTAKDLRKKSVPDEVIEAVEALTRQEKEHYFDYIHRVSKNTLAKKVKIADLRHNLQEDRQGCIPGHTKNTLAKRYNEALKMLLNGEEDLCSRCRNCGFTDDLKSLKCNVLPIEDMNGIMHCKSFDSRTIEYPITVNAININEDYSSLYKCGQPVVVRVAGEKETHFGILLGELPWMPTASYNRKSCELNVRLVQNPAIYVPSLRKVVYGAECWWSRIDSEEDTAKAITDEEINNQWYMRLLRDAMNNKED